MAKIMQKVLCVIKLTVILALFYHHSYAQAEIHGTLTGTTNYVWRMYSKSNNEPAIQANLDYQHSSGFYMGASASSFNIGKSELDNEPEFPLSFPDPAKVELTPYVGWSFKLTDNWRLDTQFTRYFYDGHIFGVIGDYNEYYLFLHFKDMLTAQISYTNDFYGLGGNCIFYEITGRYPLTDYLEISSGFGYAQTKETLSADYPYWNAGLTGRYKFISADLRYYDARETNTSEELNFYDHPHTLDATVVFSLSVGF